MDINARIIELRDELIIFLNSRGINTEDPSKETLTSLIKKLYEIPF